MINKVVIERIRPIGERLRRGYGAQKVIFLAIAPTKERLFEKIVTAHYGSLLIAGEHR